MQKTKLGISVGLLGAAVYLLGFFSGYLAVILLTGYVLLFEENEWLKKSAVKAAALMAVFSFLSMVFNLIPNCINFISNIAAVFGGSFSIVVLSRIITVITSALDIIEKVLFLGLGVKALNQGSISIPVVDKLIEKYM